ncbi:MAG: hypothetical protein LBP73_00215 [Clostridiales Family XIII bacterium]|jgi:hypothetical protein|nr:hypothetical protein [Clostridiales Family XIII bacterium]
MQYIHGRFDPDLGRADAKALDWTQLAISSAMGGVAARANVSPGNKVTSIDDGKRARVTAEAGGVDEIASTKGYSDFADGMSPDDAARYIAKNEMKFRAEFSERARANGLTDARISEAYKAMRAGDYKKMASHFDTSSPYNGAVFWSGSKTDAGRYAQSIGGTILEQTQGGRVFDGWRGLNGMYPEWDTSGALAQRPIWEALSGQYANGASGTVTFVHPSTYEGEMWKEVESEVLKDRIENGFVDKIEEVFTNGAQ